MRPMMRAKRLGDVPFGQPRKIFFCGEPPGLNSRQFAGTLFLLLGHHVGHGPNAGFIQRLMNVIEE